MKLKYQTLILLLITLISITSYIVSQQPKVWWDSEWAGIALLKGGYRSWTLRFCDGQTVINGQWQDVIITTNGYQAGHYPWPKYGHVDVRGLIKESEY